MSVQIEGRVENPDDVKVTLTITMKLSYWKRLAAKVDDAVAPGWWLSHAIQKVVKKVEAGVTEAEDLSP